jgi:hypothetical protein
MDMIIDDIAKVERLINIISKIAPPVKDSGVGIKEKTNPYLKFYAMRYVKNNYDEYYVIEYEKLKNGNMKGLIYDSSMNRVTIKPVVFNGFVETDTRYQDIPDKVKAKFQKKINDKDLDIDLQSL